jgi:hypothetical protein
MALIDFKVTTWERMSIDDDKLDDVIAKIKSGEITSSNDLFDIDPDCFFEGIVDETTEQMTIEENDNQSTIEIINAEGETIFTNVAK